MYLSHLYKRAKQEQCQQFAMWSKTLNVPPSPFLPQVLVLQHAHRVCAAGRGPSSQAQAPPSERAAEEPASGPRPQSHGSHRQQPHPEDQDHMS